MSAVPPVRLIRQLDTHRFIPCKYSEGAQSVLTAIADNEEHLQELFDLDHATNDRLWAENDLLPGITSHELVFGVKNYRIVNGAFTHARPMGSRFNGLDRGAWYAGFEIETSRTEVIFRKTQEYSEINRFEDSVSYDDYLADVSGEFHDVREAGRFRSVLDPKSYKQSQLLADELLDAGALGIVYPSVRHAGGTCIVCFRPAGVVNVRKHVRYLLEWAGTAIPRVTCTSVARL
jgi:hypothetical protein